MRLENADALYDEARTLPGGSPGLLGLVVDNEWRVIRHIRATNEDGRDAKVWVSRYPAQFYRLTTGDVEITTGSGSEMGVLMIALAHEIAAGMIEFSFCFSKNP